MVDSEAEAPSRARYGRTGVAPTVPGNPYQQVAGSRAQAGPGTLSAGVVLLMICGVALMLGSVGSWVHVTGSVGGVAALHASVNGTDPAISSLISVNGYVTFIGGIVLLVFDGLALNSDDPFLAVLTALVAAGTMVFAIYDMFRIVQKISQVTTSAGASVSVGAGLICVLSAAVLAMLVAIVRLFSR